MTDTPQPHPYLREFCALFGSAKSTISEDIDLLSASFERFDLGRIIETVAGAAGGVRFRAMPSPANITAEGSLAQQMGEILAARYYDNQPHFVLTMETKGIPVA